MPGRAGPADRPTPTSRTSRWSATSHHEKARLEPRWSELVYDGLWYSPLKQALDAFILESQRHVTGEVRLRFEPPGGLRGRASQPGQPLRHGLATYDASDTFHHADAAASSGCGARGGHLGAPGRGGAGRSPTPPAGRRVVTLWHRPSWARACRWPTRWPAFSRQPRHFDRSWPPTTWPAPGRTSAAWARAASSTRDEVVTSLAALDQVGGRARRRARSPSLPTTRTSTPRSSDG